MFHHLSGKLTSKSPALAVVDVGGAGYEVTIPLSTYERLPAEGAHVTLLTHLIVREDAHRLFGFLTTDERELFRMLISVSGIGPMLATAVLSGTSVETVRQAVIAGDAAMLKKIRGIGAKTAERMVLELKGPISRLGARAGGPSLGAGDGGALDAVAGLVSLGFSRAKAEESVAAARKKLGADAAVEALVREALKST